MGIVGLGGLSVGCTRNTKPDDDSIPTLDGFRMPGEFETQEVNWLV